VAERVSQATKFGPVVDGEILVALAVIVVGDVCRASALAKVDHFAHTSASDF